MASSDDTVAVYLRSIAMSFHPITSRMSESFIPSRFIWAAIEKTEQRTIEWLPHLHHFCDFDCTEVKVWIAPGNLNGCVEIVGLDHRESLQTIRLCIRNSG